MVEELKRLKGKRPVKRSRARGKARNPFQGEKLTKRRISLRGNVLESLNEGWKKSSSGYTLKTDKGLASLYMKGRKWFLDLDGETYELPRRANFDHAEGLIQQLGGRVVEDNAVYIVSRKGKAPKGKELHKKVRKAGFKDITHARKAAKKAIDVKKFKEMPRKVKSRLLDPNMKRLLQDKDVTSDVELFGLRIDAEKAFRRGDWKEAHAIQERINKATRIHFDTTPMSNMRLIDVARAFNREASKPKLNRKAIGQHLERLISGLDQVVLAVQGRSEGLRISGLIRDALRKVLDRADDLPEDINIVANNLRSSLLG